MAGPNTSNAASSASGGAGSASVSPFLWAAVIGIALVAGFVLWVALRRKF